MTERLDDPEETATAINQRQKLERMMRESGEVLQPGVHR